MLNKAAELYEKDTDYLLKAVAALMEPAIIIVMGLLVGFVALGILLPVFKMGSAVYH
jgi:type IV pilus assembly protein PilC